MKNSLVLTFMILFFHSGLFGQEIVRKDSITHDSLVGKTIDFQSIDMSIDKMKVQDYEFINEISQDSLKTIEFTLEKPFYIPMYHVDRSPMSFGDYNSYGMLFPNLYGYGSQTTIPGIGMVNNMSFMYQRQINTYFNFNAGVNATKYSLPYSIGQSFGVFGSVTYQPTDRFHINAFGSFSPDNRYNFNSSSYGATVGYMFTDRFGMNVGVQRYYDQQRGWQTVPIAVPHYKFGKIDLGIDVGGILYEVIRSIKYDKQQNMVRPIPVPR